MSQSATLYRVSVEAFRKLEKTKGMPTFDISSAKEYTTFAGTFMGLEYLLLKVQKQQGAELIVEIFNPRARLGEKEFEKLSHDEQMDFYSESGFICFLETAKVKKVNDLLVQVSEADYAESYNAQELNENDIYPYAWHNDNSPNQVYNQRHLSDDLIQLKKVFERASLEGDYLIVFVG